MAALNIVGGLAGAAISAARHPIGTAKKVVGTGIAVTEAAAHTAADRLRQRQGGGKPGRTTETDGQTDSAPADEESAEDVPEDTSQEEQQEEPQEAKAQPEDEPSVPPEPEVVLREPAPPAEPPVNIVEQVLAEEATQEGAGRTTEPRGASRDEEHGDAALQRAEAEEILEETAEAFPEGAVDVETPVGTTGADVAYNPDTAEADLQQPGTPPLVDDATTNAVKSESETLESAAAATERKPAPKKSTPKQTARKKST